MELANITFDATDPEHLATFWAAATGWPLTESTPALARLRSAASAICLLFLKVADGKTTKNRMHVDFRTTDRATEVTRLERLGATAHTTHHEHGLIWTVMTDPEGNEFCVVQT